jgi:hypothetical protein
MKWYIKFDRSRYSSFGELAMAFLNHFQLPVRYDAGTELLTNFEHTTTDHISDHIQEWRHWKSLIKVPVPPAFLLEWFLKSLVPQLSKDVATSRVFYEEDSILRDQQFELIYSQSGLLYNILPDAPHSILDKTRQRAGPHADGIVGSTQTKPAEQLKNQLQQLSISTQRPAKLLLWLLPLPKHRKYTPCSRLTKRPPNSLKGRKNNERRVRGIKNPLIMLAGTTQKNGRRGIHATCARKTTRPIFVLDLQRPKSLSHSNNKQC